MSLTRGDLITRIQRILGDESSTFASYLETSIDQMLYYFWDLHDWEFRHKAGTFNTVAATESYDLSTSTPDIRSSQDVQVLYNKTQGDFLNKVNLHEIRKRYPKEDTSGQPDVYAPWGTKTIFLSDNPDDVYEMHYLYLSKPTLPTSNSDDLESVCGLPDYVQYAFEKLVLAEAMVYVDETRYNSIITQFQTLLLPTAINADMKHLENSARFKFWEEELSPTGTSFDDFLKFAFWGCD